MASARVGGGAGQHLDVRDAARPASSAKRALVPPMSAAGAGSSAKRRMAGGLEDAGAAVMAKARKQIPEA
jgi:hypothetical protein